MRFQFANRQPVTIDAGEPGTISSVVNVTDVQGHITDVNVVVDVDHTFTSDLETSLTGPDGTKVLLVSGEGEKQDNFILTKFDDDALRPITDAKASFTGTFQPEEGLDAFNQLEPNGIWKLEIDDRAFEDGGTLKSWELDIEVPETVVNLINTTKTKSGLKLIAKLDKKNYQTGKKITDKQMQSLNLQRHKKQPKWNYTIAAQNITELI